MTIRTSAFPQIPVHTRNSSNYYFSTFVMHSLSYRIVYHLFRGLPVHRCEAHESRKDLRTSRCHHHPLLREHCMVGFHLQRGGFVSLIFRDSLAQRLRVVVYPRLSSTPACNLGPASRQDGPQIPFWGTRECPGLHADGTKCSVRGLPAAGVWAAWVPAECS